MAHLLTSKLRQAGRFDALSLEVRSDCSYCQRDLGVAGVVVWLPSTQTTRYALVTSAGTIYTT